MSKIYTFEEVKRKINDVCKNYSVKKAILFGSYAKNTQNSKSDVDIIIDSDGTLLNISFYGLLEDLTESFNKEIDLFEITEIEKDSSLYKEILKEGIVVYEG